MSFRMPVRRRPSYGTYPLWGGVVQKPIVEQGERCYLCRLKNANRPLPSMGISFECGGLRGETAAAL